MIVWRKEATTPKTVLLYRGSVLSAPNNALDSIPNLVFNDWPWRKDRSVGLGMAPNLAAFESL